MDVHKKIQLEGNKQGKTMDHASFKECTLKLQVLRQLLSVEAYHGHSIRDLFPMLHLLTSTNDLCSKFL